MNRYKLRAWDFELYCRTKHDHILERMLETIIREQEIRKIQKDLDFDKLKEYITVKYPFVFQNRNVNNQVAYRMAICMLVDSFKSEYRNINYKSISKLIDKDRTTMYHYLEIKDCLALPGYEFNKIAYEDVCKDLMAPISKGEFDKPKNNKQ